MTRHDPNAFLLGSVREVFEYSGVVHARYDYDPYGRRGANQITSSPVEADFGFTGHYFHAPTGLHLALFRAYDTDNGRWLSRDPIEEEAGLNLYGYVGNNPVNLTDPYGLDARTIGPITIPIPFTTEDWEKESQAAHEKQHRRDWLSGYPGWKKEQRGFAAEIPVLKNQIKNTEDFLNFKQKQYNECSTDYARKSTQYYINDLQKELRNLKNALQTAESIAGNDEAAMEYWNTAVRRWYQSEVHPPKKK